MKRTILALVAGGMMVAVPGFAEEGGWPPPGGRRGDFRRDPGDGRYDREMLMDRADRRGDRAERAERRERVRKEMELRRTLRIADEVGLDQAATLRIAEQLKAGDEKKLKLREEMEKAAEELRRLGQGAPADKDVDAAIRKTRDLRMQMIKTDDDTFDQCAKGMAPHQRAKLALVLGLHERQMRRMVMEELGMPRAPAAPGAPQPPAH